MTVRNTKRLIIFLVALLVLTSALNAFLIWWKPSRHVDYFEFAMPLFVVLMFVGTWRRLSALQAEHGPDYVPPTPPYARKLILGLGVVGLTLGAVAAYLVVRNG